VHEPVGYAQVKRVDLSVMRVPLSPLRSSGHLGGAGVDEGELDEPVEDTVVEALVEEATVEEAMVEEAVEEAMVEVDEVPLVVEIRPSMAAFTGDDFLM
jgi:hypothetical protein